MPDSTGEMPTARIAEPNESVRLIEIPLEPSEPVAAATVPHWLVATGFAGVTFIVGALTNSRVLLPDGYLSLYAGRFIATHGVPTTDPFTVAAHGQRWIDQQWLAHWLFYSAWRAGGDVAVGMLSALLVASAFGMLAMMIMRRGIDPIRAVLWASLAYFVCQPNTIIRAQSFAYPLFAALLWILLEDERRERFRWPVLLGIPVLIFWANLHGSALMGAGIAVIWALYRMAVTRLRGDHRSSDRYLATAFAFGASSMVVSTYSPQQLVEYYRSVLQNPNLAQYVPEWAPASFSGVSLVFLCMLAMLLVVAGVAVGRNKRPSWPLAVLTVVMALAGIHAARYQAWFAFPAAVLLADLMQKVAPTRPREAADVARARRLGFIAAGMLLAAAALTFAPPSGFRAEMLLLLGGFIAGLVALSMSGGDARFTHVRTLICGAVAVAVAACLGVMVTTSTSHFEAQLPGPALAAADSYAVAHPGVKVLGDDLTSPQLLWKYPGLAGRVGFDSRFEIFPDAKILPWMHFVALDTPSWAAITRGYQEIVITAQKTPALTAHLRHLPGWRVLFSDKDGLVVVRT